MTVSQVTGVRSELYGLSTDVKPITNIQAGSTFYEDDTKNGFTFDPNNICPTTSTNWWPV